MNNCKKCGTNINPGEKFCRNCGEPTGLIKTDNLEESRVVVNESPITNNQDNINNNNLNNYNQQNIQNPTINSNINNANNKTNKNYNLIAYIILAGIVVLLVVVIGVLLVLNVNKDDDKSNKHSNTNDYEEKIDNTNDNTTNNTTNTTDSTDSVTYKGFKFYKKAGYTYQSNTNSLIITSSSYFTGITISSATFSNIKANLAELEAQYQKSGVNISNLQLKTINNTEVVVGDSTINGYKGTWFIIGASKTGYIYQGYVTNKSYTTNYNDVSIPLELVKNAEYVGNYNSYSSSSDISNITK